MTQKPKTKTPKPVRGWAIQFVPTGKLTTPISAWSEYPFVKQTMAWMLQSTPKEKLKIVRVEIKVLRK